MGQPSIEVRANYLGKLPGADPHYHLVIVVRDGNGNNTYYRGGPSNGVTSSGASSGSSRSSSGSTAGSSGGSLGTGGKLITEFGAYTPDSIDYDKNAVVIYNAKLDPKDVSKVKNSLVNQMKAIKNAKIDYFATGPNSNSTVGTAMRNIGVDLQIPKGMWVPGVEQQLVDRNGLRASTVVERNSIYAKQNTNNSMVVASNTAKGYQQLNGNNTSSRTLEISENSINNKGIDSKNDVSKVVALLKENAPDVKKQYGFDVNTDDGLGKAVMQYWKENNLDPKILKDQLPDIKDSEFIAASASLANTNSREATKIKEVAMQL